MKNYIFYDNKHSYEDFNLLLDPIVLPSINEEVESIDVEGRNGTLTVRKGSYSDMIITLNFTLKRKYNESISSFYMKLDAIKAWLLSGATDLIIYLKPNKVLKVKRVTPGELEVSDVFFVNFTVEVTCEPFFYEKDERVIDITNSGYNYRYVGTAPGELIMRIHGSGNIQLTINDTTIQVNNVDEVVTLDSKLLLCLDKNNNNKSIDMIGNFPILVSGLNNITWTGNVTKVEMLPRTAYR